MGTQDNIIRDVRAVKSPCPAYVKSYILPTTSKRATFWGLARVCTHCCTHTPPAYLHTVYALYTYTTCISPYCLYVYIFVWPMPCGMEWCNAHFLPLSKKYLQLTLFEPHSRFGDKRVKQDKIVRDLRARARWNRHVPPMLKASYICIVYRPPQTRAVCSFERLFWAWPAVLFFETYPLYTYFHLSPCCTRGIHTTNTILYRIR